MKIIIELYGASKDLSPKNKIEIELKNNSKVKDLRDELFRFIDKEHSGYKNFYNIIKSSAFCSENNEIIHDDYLIAKEQKISIIPPIGGG